MARNIGLTLTPAASGDASGWIRLHGDYTLSVKTTFASPAGAFTVRLERRPVDDPINNLTFGNDDIEQIQEIVVAAGTAVIKTGTEFIRGYQHRLRCTAFTSAGATVLLQGSGLVWQ